MRFARVVVAAVLAVGVCTAALSAARDGVRSSVRNDVESTFDRVLAARDTAFDEAKRSGVRRDNSWRSSIDEEGLLIDLDRRALTSSRETAYRSAFLEELECSNHKHRGLACLMLGSVFDPALAPHLANLMDDSTEVTWRYSDACPQIANFDPWSRETVRDFAGRALEHQTGFRFASDAAFRQWWAGNGGDYQRRPWYWAAKWFFSTRHLSSPDAVKHNWDVTVSDEQVYELSRFKPDAALQILLMTDYSRLGIEEEPDARACGYVSFRYDTKAFARFVGAHGLKGRLISLLRQENLYPEIDSDRKFAFFAMSIMGLAKDVFADADEPAIAAAQRIRSPYEPPVPDMVMFRSKIAPSRARSILVGAMRADPRMLILGHELIKAAGYSEPEMILAAYKSADTKEDYINELVGATGNHRPVSLWLIREFARDLTLGDSPDYMLYVSARDLHELCRAANMASGKTLVASADIAMLEQPRTSGDKVSNERDNLEMAKFGERVRTNSERIRQELLSSLRSAKVNG